MHVIDDGIFRGYVPVNHHWINDDPNVYYAASNSVEPAVRLRRLRRSYFSAFNLEGYQVVRGQFMMVRPECPYITVTDQRVSFNMPPPEIVYTLIAYYTVNKPEDFDWVVLLVASFDAYFGTTNFGRKYLWLIPGEILERPDSGFGICRYRVREEYRI